MENQTSHLKNIKKIGTWFWPSKILLSAVKFQLFPLAAERKIHVGKGNQEPFWFSMYWSKCIWIIWIPLNLLFWLSRDANGLLGTGVFQSDEQLIYSLDKISSLYGGIVWKMLNNRLFMVFWGNLEEGLIDRQATEMKAKMEEDLFCSYLIASYDN